MAVPKNMQEKYDAVEPMIRAFCEQYLNEEYLMLCLRLLEKLCRKRPSPLMSGRERTWAAGIIYAIGSNNFLFDRSEPIHMTAQELCEPFGLSRSTVANKAAELKKMFRISLSNTEWQLERIIAKNPAVWYVSVNGFILDIRYCPVEMQEEAYRQGIIPYVPAYRKEAEKAASSESAAEEKQEEAGKAEPKADDYADIYRAFGVE